MRKLFGVLLVVALVLSFSLVATTPVGAASTWHVATTGDDGTGDGSAGDPWGTIQYAITQAVSGDTIIVAAGTYVEQIAIDRNLTILGVDNPTIEAPASAVRATRAISGGGATVYDWVVLFEAVEEFTFDGFIVDGKADGTSVRFIGLLVGNSAGTIIRNEVINARGGTDGGTGGIMAVGEDSVLDIVDNEVRAFRKGGIVANLGATANIVGNTVVGDGPIGAIAQNGIQIGFGATGTIIGNTISEVWYEPETTMSCGILVIEADDVLVEGNEIFDCLDGITLSTNWGTVHNSNVIGNEVRRAGYAINVHYAGTFTGEKLIEGNELFDNERGITLDEADGWLITGNTVEGSTSRGIGVMNAGGDNSVIGNTIANNEVGVLVANTGYGDPTGTVVSFNNIVGSTLFGVEILEDVNPISVDATHNWWGTTEEAAIQALVSGDVNFTPWLGAAMTDQPAGCTAHRATGGDAKAETDNVSADATGGDGTTTITVAEYVGEPTGVDPGLQVGAFFFDVHVGGELPDELEVRAACPGGDCSGMVLKWFDGTEWLEVSPVSYTNGEVVAELNNVDSSPLISELTGTPFGLGGPPLVPAAITVGWDGTSINKAAIMAPWIALLATMLAGAIVLVARRRGARI